MAFLGKTQCVQELLQEQVQSPSLKTSTDTPALKSPNSLRTLSSSLGCSHSLASLARHYLDPLTSL